ncbi:uncharacterized protein STEHIDRAFT_161571 [Stereum hirsutum FP-91666 SS1]|uniref:uncharacterized protein n=1 Tax=Stereum hirsutum (strain FP-91666) TaxID=721885 RepID=UPI000444A646|nr:uncharacterized protein STEHIDRAFT_161571 [Stereum hirsutum FP-91666 SS1]EIM81377.1 hypothetical protein STEHIDRAFT_161571 [Stereum hirsutum FP-91666 SS1]
MFTNPFDTSPVSSTITSMPGPHDSGSISSQISSPSITSSGGPNKPHPRRLSLTIPPIPHTTDHGRRLSTVSTPLREHAPTTPHEWDPPTPGPFSPRPNARVAQGILRNSKPHSDTYYATLPKRESAPEHSIAMNLPSSREHHTTDRPRFYSLPAGLARKQAKLSPEFPQVDLNTINTSRPRRYSLAQGPPISDDYFHHLAGSPANLASAPDTPPEHIDSPFPSPPINADDSHAGVNREGRWVSLPSTGPKIRVHTPLAKSPNAKSSVRFQSFRYQLKLDTIGLGGAGSKSSFLEGRRHSSVAVTSAARVATPPLSRTASGVVA